jgi:hypothetical protein
MYFADTRTGVMLEEIPIRQNKVLVGTYDLTKGRKKVGVLTIHPKGMVINGKKPKEFGLSGNKATWKGITGGGVFRDGFFEFSDKGDKIIRSSFDTTGRICPVPRNQPAVNDEPLSVQDLLKQYPFDQDGMDQILDKSKDDFYTLIEYFMPEDYLHHFIRPDRPQLDGYLTQIAQDDVDNPGENATFYDSLAVPYLTYVLSGSDKNLHPDSYHLNANRSDMIMKTTMQDSPVFNRHSGKLYRYHWRQKFPRMQLYLDDQAYTDYSSTIATMNAQWIQEITDDLGDAYSPEDLNDMIQHAQAAGQAAIDNNQYWAYQTYRDLATTDHFNTIRMQIVGPREIPDIMRDQENYCSIMSILDPTAFFSYEYTYALGTFKMSEIIPTYFDPSEIDDMDVFAKMVLDKFVEMYSNNPDPQLAQMAQAIAETMATYTWQVLLPVFTAAASISTNWTTLYSNLKRSFSRGFGKFGSLFATGLALGCITFAIQLLATQGAWNELTPTQQAAYVTACARGSAFMLKKGYDILSKLTNGWWEAIKPIFYKTKEILVGAVTRFAGAIGRFIVKHGWANRMAQGLKRIEKVIGKFFNKAYKKLKCFGNKLSSSSKLAAGFGGLLSIVGSIISAIEIARSSTPMETAMNVMFLLSSVADIVAIAVNWLISKAYMQVVLIGGTTVGVSTLTTIATIASGVAIAAAVAGVVVMMVFIFTNKDPPDPIREFVHSDEVANAGMYMVYKTSVEYFAAQMDDEDEVKQIGITMTTDGNNYMHVNANGSITFGNVDYSYNTVFTVTTDQYAYSQILTKQRNPDDVIYYLTVNTDNSVTMSELFEDENDAQRQQFIIDCTGNVVSNADEQLQSATFSIYNDVNNIYVRKNGNSIGSGTSPQDWTLELEYMQPSQLDMRDALLNTKQFDRKFFPYLGQPGSTSGRSFSISPALPSWLEFDNKIGSISQAGTTTAPVTPATTYTMTVTNSYGSDSDSFVLKVEEADQ